MSVQIQIAGTTYNFPTSGDDPNWGPDATDTISALAAVVNTLFAPGDILNTSFTISNNIAVVTNINGLLFDPGTVRAANVGYTVYRTSDDNPAGHTESGTILINFDDDAAVNSKWSFTIVNNGNAGIAFSILDSGQFQYLSSDIGSLGYVGNIVFTARALPKI